ncbi:MAG: glycoside hydrolase family 20 zincin-like fold domain-containing protein [Bacteroidota bacterium]
MIRILPLTMILLSMLLLACDQSTRLIEEHMTIHLLPVPQQMSQPEQVVVLSETSNILASDSTLLPLAQLFSDEVMALYGVRLAANLQQDQSSDIIFKLDPTLQSAQYQINIHRKIVVRGGSYQALTMVKGAFL